MTSIDPIHGGTCSMIPVQCSPSVGSSTLVVSFSSSLASSLSCALLAFFSRDSQSLMRGIFAALDTLSFPISQLQKSLSMMDLTMAGQMPAALYVPQMFSEPFLITVTGP